MELVDFSPDSKQDLPKTKLTILMQAIDYVRSLRSDVYLYTLPTPSSAIWQINRTAAESLSSVYGDNVIPIRQEFGLRVARPTETDLF
jgi:hypothetical protein